MTEEQKRKRKEMDFTMIALLGLLAVMFFTIIGIIRTIELLIKWII